MDHSDRTCTRCAQPEKKVRCLWLCTAMAQPPHQPTLHSRSTCIRYRFRSSQMLASGPHQKPRRAGRHRKSLAGFSAVDPYARTQKAAAGKQQHQTPVPLPQMHRTELHFPSNVHPRPSERTAPGLGAPMIRRLRKSPPALAGSRPSWKPMASSAASHPRSIATR